MVESSSSTGDSTRSSATTTINSESFQNLTITSHKLNGRNFLQWSQSVKLFIRGRSKFGYLSGTTTKPDEKDEGLDRWEAENSMIMSWLINSMEPNVGRTYLFLPTAHAIWEAVNETYSDLGNTGQWFELKTQLWKSRQGEKTVTQYYTDLKTLWQEIDLFSDYEWSCSKDQAMFQKMVEKERVFEFLVGLNKELDDVRGRILGRTPLPSTREVFAEVRREESRRTVMLGETTSSPPPSVQNSTTTETAALFSRSKPDNHQYNSSHQARTPRRSDRPTCDYCKGVGHIKARCWKLHGKPADFQSSNRPTKSYQASVEESSQPAPPEQSAFSKEQLEQLYQIVNSQANAFSSLAQKGTIHAALSVSLGNSNPWIIDSGATDHMTGNSYIFSSYFPCAGNQKVKIADGSLSSIAGKGSIVISPTLTLQNVLHVPNLSCNLISVSSLIRDCQCLIKFLSSGCLFQDLHSGTTIGSAKEVGGLYHFDNGKPVEGQVQRPSCTSFLCLEDEIMLWHYRLGHPSFSYLKHLFPLIFKNKDVNSFQCEVCEFAKHHRSVYPALKYMPSKPFSLVHSDIWGPSRVKTISGARWFITFIDDHTRTTWIYLLKEKSEASITFQNFHSMINTQFQSKIQVLRTDNGREYFNTILGSFLTQQGIIHHSSCVITPQQNGIAERKNRHLLEVARSLIFGMNVPQRFWGEAILTASTLINRMPSRILKFITPMNALKTAFPLNRSFTELSPKVFGCTAFVHIHHNNRSKFDPRALKCVFLGFSPTQKGYRCFDPLSGKFYVSMDVTFFENKPFYDQTSLQGENGNSCDSEAQFWETICTPTPIFDTISPITNSGNVEPIPTSQIRDINETNTSLAPTSELRVYSRRKPRQNVDIPTTTLPVVDPSADQGKSLPPIHFPDLEPESIDLDEPIAIRKGIRACTKHPISHYVSYSNLSPSFRAFTSSITNDEIPKSIHEALADPRWKQAVFEEMEALRQNDTWELTSLPSGKQPVSSKWVFTVKYNADGTVERYKARLVARGFTQTYGLDYEETFAPVAKLNTVRVLLSLATNLDWPLHQLDVKNAFLNGELEEEVFMEIPPGFEDMSLGGKVCRLKKSLYGLKQSPRAWFGKFSKAVKGFGYTQAQSDSTLFYKHSGGKIAVLIVYVDDIVLTGDHQEELEALKKFLSKQFEIKDLGSLKYFLGMEVARSPKGIAISQRKYVLDLLKETGMLGCKPASTPVDPKHRFEKEGSASANRERYQKMVGKLIYLSHTRPDIAFAVGLVSQFMHCPSEDHFQAVYRILRYLKGSPGKGILFKKNDSRKIEVFTDADWAGNSGDRRSTSAYCTFVWGNLVTWRSKKQNVVSRSSAESEYRSMAQGVCEIIWLRRILEELKVQVEAPMKLFCDNKSAISIANNPVQHDRTKHVEIDRYFIKEKLENGEICMPFVPSEEQLADVLTKGLFKQVFDELIVKLGMIDIFAPT